MDGQQLIESRGHRIWLACIICPIITGAFVLSRAYARIFITKKIALSDWVCFVTLSFIIAFCVTLAQATYTGLGRHTSDITPEMKKGMEFWILVSSVFYVLSLLGYKVALILLYLQIFGISRKFRWTCYVVLAYTVSYLFCNLVVQLAGCTPIEKFWDKKVPGHCTKTNTQNIAFGVGHMSSDFFVAVLPLPMIWKLQLRNVREKVGLFFVLGSGVIAWVVAVIRFTYATVDLTSKDQLWIAGITFFLSVLEVSTGLICGCTPALKPLFISIKESTNVWSRKMSSSYDNEGRRKNSGSYFSRKRSEGDATSQGRNSLHSDAKGLTELKNISGSGNSSAGSAPNSRRPTTSGTDAVRPIFVNDTKIKVAPQISREPMARNPESDTWNDYSMSFPHGQDEAAIQPNKSRAQHPPVVESRLGAPPIPHMDSDELFKGYGGGNKTSKHHASDDVEAQHEEVEEHEGPQRGHQYQKSNPNEQSVRDFLADGPSHPQPRPPPLKSSGGFIPRSQTSQQRSNPPPPPPPTSQPASNPSNAMSPFPPPQPKPTTEDQTAHHATRAQILLDQTNRPPSDRQIPTLAQRQQQSTPSGPQRFDSQDLFSGTALHPVHEAGVVDQNSGARRPLKDPSRNV